MIFNAVDTIPSPTPIRIARFAARFGTFKIQSASHATLPENGPSGKNRIITTTADTNRIVASSDRARNARYAADAMKNASNENIVASVGRTI